MFRTETLLYENMQFENAILAFRNFFFLISDILRPNDDLIK